MSLLYVEPDMSGAGATDLAAMGASLGKARAVAAASTIGLAPAGADEVSAGIAHLFSMHGADFHKAAGMAATFHHQFVQNMNASAQAYARGEAANAAALASWPAADLGALLGGSAATILNWAHAAWNSVRQYAEYVPLWLALLALSPVLVPAAIPVLVMLQKIGPII